MRGGEGERSRLGPLFAAKSWGYSAFQYILPCQTPETYRCASRFATTASALRASAAPQPGGRALKLRNLPENFGRHTAGSSTSRRHPVQHDDQRRSFRPSVVNRSACSRPEYAARRYCTSNLAFLRNDSFRTS